MNNSDKLQLSIAIPVFIGFVVLTMYYYWQGDKLFKLLASRHPKYYKENGEPLYFGPPLSNLWAGLYLTHLLIRGLPKDFPDDSRARELAKRSRKVGLVIFMFLFTILGIIYYQVNFT